MTTGVPSTPVACSLLDNITRSFLWPTPQEVARRQVVDPAEVAKLHHVHPSLPDLAT